MTSSVRLMGVVLLAACGPAVVEPCGPASCPSGCCDAQGVCRDGTEGALGCGTAGQQCAYCSAGTRCEPTLRMCVASMMSSGGGAAAGGGSAVGGGSAEGGGTASGGGTPVGGGSALGGGAAAGGTASVGGGSTGGGSAVGGGGGSGVTGGGSSAGGGGTPQGGGASTGGGAPLGGGAATGGGNASTCAAGFHECGYQCVDDSLVATCGQRCDVCPSNGGTPVCTAGTCGVTCGAGLQACNGSCVAACLTCPANLPTQCAGGFEPGSYTEQQLGTGFSSGQNFRLAIDGAGASHVVFTNAATGQYAIRYGSNRTGAWAFETVALPTADPMATVIQGRVVVTRCGAPTVFYIRSHVPSGGSRIVQRLFMATRVGATWSETLVPVPHTPNDPTEDYVDHFDLTAAPDDTLWLTASRAASTWLLNLPPSGSWTSEAVPASYSSISGPVVAVHPTFGPILGYGTSTVGSIGFSRKVNGTWQSTLIAGSRPLGSSGLNYRPSLAIAADPQGVITMIWGAVDSTTKTLYAARYTSSWDVPARVYTATSWVADDLNLWLDAKGVPWVTYDVFSGGFSGTSAVMSHLIDGRWLSDLIPKGVSGVATAASDANARVFVLVSDQQGLHFRTQRCAQCVGSACAQVAYATHDTAVSAMTLNDAGQPVIGVGWYIDTPSGLRVAQTVGDDWHSAWVTTPLSVGWVSTALDGQGRAAFGISDLTNGDLLFAQNNGLTWQVTTVDSVGSVGAFNSLKFDAAGNPAMAYFDLTNGDLKFARFNGATWSLSTVDSAGDVGRSSSLAFTAQGLPRIAYVDTTHQALKYASFDGTTWSTESLDAPTLVSGTALALDALGRPHLASSTTGTTSGLRHVWHDGTAWRAEEVDGPTPSTGYQPAIAIDANNRARIAYGEFTSNRARLARQTSTGWALETLWAASGTTTPGRFSLAVDAQGRSIVSWSAGSVYSLRR